MNKEISKVVEQFRHLSDAERYVFLSTLFEGNAEGDELTWRAHLCTALQRAGVYPQERPEL